MQTEILADLDPRAIMLLPSNDARRIAFEAAVAEQLKAEREAEAARKAERKAEPSAVDCRAALAQAITKRNAAAGRLADLVRAVPKAEAAVFTARTGAEQASNALEDVKQEAASHHAAAGMGKTSGTAPSIAKARRALEVAEDELEAAQAASAELQKEHAAVERKLSFA